MTARGRLLLIGGGARSGKSAFALDAARALGERRAFIATARAGDDEMRARIARHAAERGPSFRTVEEQHAVADAVAGLAGVDVAVVDCLTLWLANLMIAGRDGDAIAGEVGRLLTVLRAATFPVIVVTNEVGMGVVPETPMGRVFRDVAGRAHQMLARAADEVYVGVLGAMLRLKPAPVEALFGGYESANP